MLLSASCAEYFHAVLSGQVAAEAESQRSFKVTAEILRANLPGA